MKAEQYIKNLRKVKLDAVFNPYTDTCETTDRKDANKIRRNNLLSYLKAVDGNVESIWFGRDLGYRGGRRTGLALTDENHLHVFSKFYGGVDVSQATNGEPMSERTANVIWKMLGDIPQPPFLWNIFPFHPHEPDNPMTNRNHTAAERRRCEPLIIELIDWLKPVNIVAIGNDAFKALNKLGFKCDYVRHPSYGGQTDFINGIRKIYNLNNL